MKMFPSRPGYRLTDRKVNRAMQAVEALLYCVDLPAMGNDGFKDYGDIRSELEHVLVDTIGPLHRLVEDSEALP